MANCHFYIHQFSNVTFDVLWLYPTREHIVCITYQCISDINSNRFPTVGALKIARMSSQHRYCWWFYVLSIRIILLEEYIYIYMCVCVCVCIGRSLLCFKNSIFALWVTSTYQTVSTWFYSFRVFTCSQHSDVLRRKQIKTWIPEDGISGCNNV
jgi:hypothetical protein